VWDAALDPAALPVRAAPVDPGDPDAIRLAALAPWLTVVAGADGWEHAVLSDGRHHLRLDVEAGRLSGERRSYSTTSCVAFARQNPAC
jgi:hypothetical protein